MGSILGVQILLILASLTSGVSSNTAEEAIAKPAAKYDVVLLGRPETGIIHPASINDSGDVAGTLGAFHYHAAIWSNGFLKDLGTLPGDTYSTAVAINSSGHVVGFSNKEGGSGMRAFFWDGTVLHPIGPAHVYRCQPTSMNDNDDIVLAVTYTSGAPIRCVVVTSKGMLDTGLTNTGDAVIDKRGRIAAGVPNLGTGGHGVLWTKNKTTDLGVFADATSSIPTAMSDRMVVGYAQPSEQTKIGIPSIPSYVYLLPIAFYSEKETACAWQQGRITDLGSISQELPMSRALGVNRDGVIVGYSFPPIVDSPMRAESTATLWAKGEIQNLNDLVNHDPKVFLESATGINSSGCIIAEGIVARRRGKYPGNWDRAGFLLIPHTVAAP